MHGLLHEPAGQRAAAAVLRLRARPARKTLRIVLHGGSRDQEVEVVLNRTPLGRVPALPEWKEISFEIPTEAFDPSGLQLLEVRASKVNDDGLGVALRSVRVDPSGLTE
jgi:hypothetical protein